MNSANTYLVARQPIFTRARRLWGYELLFRNSVMGLLQPFNPEEATAAVMLDGLSLIFSSGKPNIKALINVPASMLHADALEHLPQESCILEILEDTMPAPHVVVAIRRLKQRGYTLALDDYIGQPEMDELLPFVDIVKVDFLGLDSQGRERVTAALLQHRQHTLLAEKVESWDDVQQALDLGYTLFQGYYFQKPEILHGRKMPPTLMVQVRALTLLSQEAVDKKDLLDFFTRSPELTFRLLKFVNSAAFAKTKKIETLNSALTFLGTRPLRHWLMAVLLADGQQGDVRQEITFLGTERARFLENIAELYNLPEPDTYFMTGLFSSLEALYGIPFEQLFDVIPVSDAVYSALVNEAGPVYPWLQVVVMLGRGMLKKAERHMREMGVTDFVRVAACYQDAVRFARDTLHSGK